MKTYQVAVVLINYNSSNFTIDCIHSIEKQSNPSVRYQIIVVDNNSSLEEYQKLEAVRGTNDITIFRSKINLGFSGANMLGVQFADSEYYYFLNNDCVLLNDCLGILCKFMDNHPQVANCSGEMFIANGEYECNFRYFPSLGVKLLGSGFLRLFSPGKYPSRHKRMALPTKVDLVNGSSMFIRATSFDDIGGFDTNYFLYSEEEDIALRLWRAGYSTFMVPSAGYQHFVSQSTQSDNRINLVFLKEFFISYFYYFGKNYNGLYRWSMQVFFFFKTIRKFYKNWDYARLAFFIAAGANVRHSLRFKQKIGENLK
jgi:GT2 family glycosyltransferase